MAERQPSWDKYEAAILLEGILASMKGELTRSDAVKAVSHDLRAMAVHRGIEIDAVYRNTNGISFQMKSMESAYLGRTVFKPATRLFTGVASLYHDSHDEYQKLLKEARAMIIDGKTVKDDFMRYLAEQVSPAQLSDFYICYSEIETFCLKIKVLQKPLFQTTDIETIKKVQRTIEQNKFFRITRRKQINKIVAAGRYYYNYIKEGLYSRIGIEETAVEESNTATQTFQPQHTHNIANDTMSKSVASEQSDEINSRSFSRYLSETLKMADATSRSYSSAINNCEVFAREHQLPSWQLYTSDRQAAQETIRLLLNDADFLSYNARQHNRFRAALQKFLMFIGAEPQQTVPTKADIDSASPYRNEGYEQELIDELLKKIKTNLTNGDYQKAILIADHGASRLAVIHGTENLWEMQSSGKHSGRCCPKSEVDERPDSATDAEDFWALANYDRFKGSRKANVEVHGGATLEEVTVPIIEISYLNDAVEVKIMPIDSTATFTGIPEIFVSFRKKAAIKVFSTEKLVDVSVVIDGHTYEAKPTADNFYVVEEMTEIRRAKTYSVDVFAGGMPVATGLPLRVKKESGSEKNIL